MNAINFPTLTSYIDWRNTSRAKYKSLSEEIRSTKLNIRKTMSSFGGYAGTMQNKLIALRSQATEIMEIRLASKEFARDSWNRWQSERIAAA